VTLFEHVVKIRKTTLPENHSSQLRSKHELARAYLVDERIKEALTLSENIVKIQKTTLTEDHSHRLISEDELAHTYLFSDQIKEA
jgi:hypothetical protein